MCPFIHADVSAKRPYLSAREDARPTNGHPGGNVPTKIRVYPLALAKPGVHSAAAKAVADRPWLKIQRQARCLSYFDCCFNFDTSMSACRAGSGMR